MSTDSNIGRPSSNIAKDPVVPAAVASVIEPKLPLLTQQQKTPVTADTLGGTERVFIADQGFETAMRELVLKARKITFSGDEIRLGKIRQDSLVSPVLIPGLTKNPRGAGGAPKITDTLAGSTNPTTSVPVTQTQETSLSEVVSEELAAAAASPTSEKLAESVSDLKFAPGVDPRIKEGIASKVKKIESDVGKPLLVTSGFRDPQRNAAAGGARNSAHTRANAVDIRFSGSVEDTVKFIEEASAEGVGGIGVYGPGRVHLDTESKRVWGPDFTARSIPEWAKPALEAHMGSKAPDSSSQAGGDAAAVSTEPVTSSMSEPTATEGGGSAAAVESGSTETASPSEMVASDTGMGQAVTSASQENAIEERIPAPVTETISDAADGGSSPNPSVGAPIYAHSPDDPGNVEPEDAAERYARLFNMAA